MFYNINSLEVLQKMGFSASDLSANVTFTVLSQANNNSSKAYLWINDHITDISWGEIEMSSNKTTISHTFSMTWIGIGA